MRTWYLFSDDSGYKWCRHFSDLSIPLIMLQSARWTGLSWCPLVFSVLLSIYDDGLNWFCRSCQKFSGFHYHVFDDVHFRTSVCTFSTGVAFRILLLLLSGFWWSLSISLSRAAGRRGNDPGYGPASVAYFLLIFSFSFPFFESGLFLLIWGSIFFISSRIGLFSHPVAL